MAVLGEFVATNAVTGVLEYIFWYRNGILSIARVKGFNRESVETV